MELDVALDDIFMDEDFNCRGHISPASVGELSLDIERNGLFQAIVLQPHAKDGYKYKVVMGHRRYLAVKSVCERNAKFPKTIRAHVVDSLPEGTARIHNLKENLSRENLNMLQEARAIEWFRNQGWEIARVARELGQPAKWVKVRYALLELPEQIQKRAEAGWLTQYQVEELAEMPTDEDRFRRVRDIIDKKLRNDKPLSDKQKKAHARQRSKFIFGQGQPRTLDQIFDVQEKVQAEFDDVAHPAAVALSWVAGVISEEEFWAHAKKWRVLA